MPRWKGSVRVETNSEPVAQPGHGVCGERLQRGAGVLDDGGQRRGPGAEHGRRAGPARLAGVVMAVDVLAGEGDEEAARLGLPAVEYGRRGHCHGGVALDRAADDRGDLPEAERDHAVSLWVMPPVKAPRCIENRIRSGNTTLP